MTDTLKNLGQLTPAAATLSTLYPVPGATVALVSTLVVCNTTTSGITFRFSHALAGAADTTAQYLYWDQPLNAGDTFTATLGITAGATDVLRCRASAAGVAFNLYGDEVS